MAFGDRRTPLQRKTPLRNTSELRNTTGLRRSTPLPRTGISRSAVARNPDGEGASAEPGVTERSNRRPALLLPSGPVPAPRRRGAAPVPAALRRMVIERAEESCDRCGRYLVGQLYSLQHRRARGAGGRRGGYLDTAANLVVLCGSATSPGGCHLWAESASGRTTESSQGFVIRGELDAPESVPILRHGRDWVVPGQACWIPAEPLPNLVVDKSA